MVATSANYDSDLYVELSVYTGDKLHGEIRNIEERWNNIATMSYRDTS